VRGEQRWNVGAGVRVSLGEHRPQRAQVVDYRLNRWYCHAYRSLGDIREAAQRTEAFDDWKPEILRQAE